MDAHAHAHGPTMPSPVGLGNIKLAMWLFLVSEIMFFAGLIGAYIVLRFGTPDWIAPYDILAVRITAANTFLLICSSVTMVKAFQWSDFGDRKRAIAYLVATIIGGACFVGVQVYEYKHLFHKPSEALLHHVEHIAHERGIHLDDAHAAAEPVRIMETSLQEESTASEQEAVVKQAYALLHEGRPEVRGRGSARLEAQLAAQEWDKAVMDGAVLPLVEAFPDDKTIQKYGKHHNLYPEGFVPGRDVFTSTFYIMTGFHGAHVSGGVIALIVILCFYITRKAGTLALEVVGLYWHFVDLVWILLFTIVYLM